MNKKFDQLIWVGAGSVSEPKGLIEQANSALLIEARVDACKRLRSQFAGNEAVRVQQQVVSPAGDIVVFHQYNLPEFSALHQVSGLTQFFPGLKLTLQDSVQSQSFIEVLADAKLTKENNALVLDVADIALTILRQLSNHNLLSHFSQIIVMASAEPLYRDAATTPQLTDWMLQNGFAQTAADHSNTDFPWLFFGLNPLWGKLQQTQNELQQTTESKNEIAQELDKTKKQLSELQQSFDSNIALLAQQNDAFVSEKAIWQQKLITAEVIADKAQSEFDLRISLMAAESKNTLQRLESVELQLNDTKQQLESLTQQLALANSEVKTQEQYVAELKLQLEQSKLLHNKQLAHVNDIGLKQEQELAELKIQLEQAKATHTKLLENATEQLTIANNKVKKHEQDSAESRQQLEQYKLTHSKQLESATQQIALASEKVLKQEAEISGLRHQLEQVNTECNKQTAGFRQQLEANAELSAQMQVYKQWQASVTQQQDSVQQKIVADVSKKLTNSVKQIEAFISLRDLLAEGRMPLNYHGWPISADIALYLAKKVTKESFDYIIEFGSGTSTVIFAKSLQMGEQKKIHAERCRLISFEHNKVYLQKTVDDLVAHQVEHLVDLVYAPLIEMQCDENNYLYYSCEDKLAEISKALQHTGSKILVLIDGPPADTGPMARYPAIPLLLKYLAKHQLHIIMDDYVREDEKKAAAKWSRIFEERGIKHQKELLNFEKVGFSWILNN